MDRIKFDGLGLECAVCGIDAAKKQNRCPICGKPFTDKPWLVYKYPSDKITTGSKLVVSESQKAIFVKLGKVADILDPGTHDLVSHNLPLLNKLVNLPYGGKTPFPAEAYFINMTSKNDLKWGTFTPFQTTDPKFGIIIRVRSYGNFGVKVTKPDALLHNIVGSMKGRQFIDYQKLLSYLRSVVVSTVKGIVASYILKGRSILEITSDLPAISEICKRYTAMQFREMGLELTGLLIESINIPDEDLDGIKSTLNRKAEFDVLGDQRYVTMRSFDVLEKAAETGKIDSQSSLVAGMGLGIGLNSAKNVIESLNNGGDTESIPLENSRPVMSLESGNIKHCVKCGEKIPGDAAFCTSCGEKVEPLICHECGEEIVEHSHFCHHCGCKLNIIVCDCGTSNLIESKFCRKCGRDLPVETEPE